MLKTQNSKLKTQNSKLKISVPKIVYSLFLLSIFLLSSAKGYAQEEINNSCNACTSELLFEMAALNEATPGNLKIVYLYNFQQGEMRKYQVFQPTNRGRGAPAQPTAVMVPVESNKENLFLNVKNEYQAIQSSLNSITDIPISVVENGPDLIRSQFAQNDLYDHINAQSGIAQRIINLGNMLSIMGVRYFFEDAIWNVEFRLQDGSRVILKPTSVDITGALKFELVEVIDGGNNTLPQDVEGLINTEFRFISSTGFSSFVGMLGRFGFNYDPSDGSLDDDTTFECTGPADDLRCTVNRKPKEDTATP